jgi:hypothetical protein
MPELALNASANYPELQVKNKTLHFVSRQDGQSLPIKLTRHMEQINSIEIKSKKII